jgi:hypothetical protein
MEGEEFRIGFWWGDLWEEDHLEDPGIEGGYYANGSLRSGLGGMGLFWLRIGTGGGRL